MLLAFLIALLIGIAFFLFPIAIGMALFFILIKKFRELTDQREDNLF